VGGLPIRLGTKRKMFSSVCSLLLSSTAAGARGTPFAGLPLGCDVPATRLPLSFRRGGLMLCAVLVVACLPSSCLALRSDKVVGHASIGAVVSRTHSQATLHIHRPSAGKLVAKEFSNGA